MVKLKTPDIFPVPKLLSRTGNALILPRTPSFRVTAPEEWARTADIIRAELCRVFPEATFGDAADSVEILMRKQDNPRGPEAYTLNVSESQLLLEAADAPGILYAGMTLAQLAANTPKGPALPLVSIEDWPDVPLRACSRWLIDLEGSRMAYDWGDGREAMLRRYRAKLDFAMRYKINVVFFDGFQWNTRKYPEYAQDMRTLWKYAAERNIRLEYGGHYIGVGGRFPEFSNAVGCGFQKGLGDMNRVSYPDGDLYPCMGKELGHPTQFNGTCRSNDVLGAIKEKQIHDYVSAVEPGMIYGHPEDISELWELASDWSLRCDSCRRKWPSDIPEAQDGAAGAQAYGLAPLCRGIASVKNNDGYDGARDCIFCIVPMAYAAFDVPDDIWERLLVMYENIARKLPPSPQCLLLMREQFFRHDNAAILRTEEMARRLKAVSSCRLAMFAINGADTFTNGRFFAPGALLNAYYRGSELIFNFSGTIHQEVQEIFNSECCWNIPPVTPAIQKELEHQRAAEGRIRMGRLSVSQRTPARMLSTNGLVTRICRHYYGPKAAEGILKLIRLSGAPYFPLTDLMARFDKEHLLDGSRYERTTVLSRAFLAKEWAGIARSTEAAWQAVRFIRHAPKDPFAREDLEALARTLNVSRDIARLLASAFACRKPAERKDFLPEIGKIRRKMNHLFAFDFTSPADGPHGLWPEYLERIAKFLKGN